MGEEAYYPVNNEETKELYEKYRSKAAQEENVLFGGRLGEFRYYDMDKVIRSALDAVRSELDR